LPGGKKIQKLFDQAMSEKTSFKRREELKEILDKEPDHYAACFHYAEEIIQRAKTDYRIDVKVARKYLEKVVELCPSYHCYTYYYLGSLALGAKEYQKAIDYFDKFLNFEYEDGLDYPKDYDEKAAEAQTMKDKAIFYRDLYGHPVPYDPKVVKGVSTKDNEYLAIISPDDELALYIRNYNKKSKNDLTPKWVEEFTYSTRTPGGTFSSGTAFPPPFNTADNVGGASITVDNKTMYLTICKVDNQGYKNCDIYSSEKSDTGWSKPEGLGPGVNNPNSFEGQPSISSDGKTLYFVSIRDDSIGNINNMDLYVSFKNDSGKWSPAQNLGKNINTEGNEKSPFIHSDSQTLYFSSGDAEWMDGSVHPGLPGLGGFDIFYTKKDSTGKWMKSKNIGYPINSEKDDLGFFVSTNGKTAYFSSNELDNGVGGWDLYSFRLYKEARPERVLFVKGQIKNDTDMPVKDTKLELKNVRTKEVTHVPIDSVSGKYVAVVQFKDDYIMTVKKKGAAFDSKYISKEDSTFDAPAKMDMEVQKIKKGGTYKINNINYESNSYNLDEISKTMLTEFADFLKENPKMKVAIHGHTDFVGSDEDNMVLSENRAKSVYDFLVQKGIDKSRLSYKGFGKSQPIDTNQTEEGRARNRRTEFVITSL